MIRRPVVEADVARQIREYLERALGLRCFRADAGFAGGRGARRSSSIGLPDLFGILPSGRMWAVEVKRPGARARKNEARQLEVLEYLREQGALVIVARDVVEVQRAFEEARWATRHGSGN